LIDAKQEEEANMAETNSNKIIVYILLFLLLSIIPFRMLSSSRQEVIHKKAMDVFSAKQIYELPLQKLIQNEEPVEK